MRLLRTLALIVLAALGSATGAHAQLKGSWRLNGAPSPPPVTPTATQEFLTGQWTSSSCAGGAASCSTDGKWFIYGTHTGTGGNQFDPSRSVIQQSSAGEVNQGYIGLTVLPFNSGVGVYQGGEVEADGAATGYGYYEARIKPSCQAGGIASYFLQVAGGGYPEFDVEIPLNALTTVFFTLHPKDSSSFTYSLGFNACQAFHRYGMLWTLDPGGATATVAYYVDGIFTGHSESDASFLLPTGGMWQWANSWISGSPTFGGTAPSSPSTSYYDYARFYAGATSVPNTNCTYALAAYQDGCATTVPAPVPTPPAGYAYDYKQSALFTGYGQTSSAVAGVSGYSPTLLANIIQSPSGYGANRPNHNVAGSDFPIGIDSSKWGAVTSTNGVLKDPLVSTNWTGTSCSVQTLSPQPTGVPLKYVVCGVFNTPYIGTCVLPLTGATQSNCIEIQGFDWSGLNLTKQPGGVPLIFAQNGSTGSAIIHDNYWFGIANGGLVPSSGGALMISAGTSVETDFYNNYLDGNQQAEWNAQYPYAHIGIGSPITKIWGNYIAHSTIRPIVGPACGNGVNVDFETWTNYIDGMAYKPQHVAASAYQVSHGDPIYSICSPSVTSVMTYLQDYNVIMTGGPSGGGDMTGVLTTFLNGNTLGFANFEMLGNSWITNAGGFNYTGSVSGSSLSITVPLTHPTNNPINGLFGEATDSWHSGSDFKISTTVIGVPNGYEGIYPLTLPGGNVLAGYSAALDTFVGSTSGVTFTGYISNYVNNGAVGAGNILVVVGDTSTTPLTPGEVISDTGPGGFGLVPVSANAQLPSSWTCTGCEDNGLRGVYPLQSSPGTIASTTLGVVGGSAGWLYYVNGPGNGAGAGGYNNVNVDNNWADPTGILAASYWAAGFNVNSIINAGNTHNMLTGATTPVNTTTSQVVFPTGWGNYQ